MKGGKLGCIRFAACAGMWGSPNRMPDMLKIPFHKPLVLGSELSLIARMLDERLIGSDGRFTQGCARFLEDRFGIGKVLMTPSCTGALEMAAWLCGLQDGDEVIMPSFTFPSTANAVVRTGATPVFVDIRADTLNIDENLVEKAVSPRTKAIIPVHYAGVACEMQRIMGIADTFGVHVIEDAAQAIGAFHNGRALGSIGHLGAFSFHYTKNVTCGEGGALCLNRPELIDRAEIIRDKGTNRQAFFRGKVDRYVWVDLGSSYVPSEILSAFLLAQLEQIETITEKRREIYETYRQNLDILEQQGMLRMPVIPAGCASNYHTFYILLPDRASRDGLLSCLVSQGIGAAFHYAPLHLSPMGIKLGYAEGNLPITEDLSDRLLRLPVYHDLSTGDLDTVVQAVSHYLRVGSRRSAVSVR